MQISLQTSSKKSRCASNCSTVNGPRYEASSALLQVLAAAYYVNVMLGFNSLTLQMLGRLRFIVAVNFLTMSLNLGLDWWLIPAYGVWGATRRAALRGQRAR